MKRGFWAWYGCLFGSYQAAWCFAGAAMGDVALTWVSFCAAALCITLVVP